jgi:ornithine cyclodeaminase
MPACIRLMEEALASLARGEVILPLRPVIRIPDTPNAFAVMPAYSRGIPALGAKLISVFPENHGTELDSHQGVVALFDAERGNLSAIIDAVSITAIRTAAVSGVATQLLAREDTRQLAILGSGVQARTHIQSMLAVRRFETVRVWSRSAEHAERLVREFAADDRADFEVARTADDAVRDADVVCTVTASREPVLRGAALHPGMHVNAVGASLPTTRELDTDAVAASRIFVDRKESALNEAGDLLIPMKEGAITASAIVAEIGELLIGSSPGRTSPTEITLFKSLGLAVEDLASAVHLRREAERDGSGTWIDL